MNFEVYFLIFEKSQSITKEKKMYGTVGCSSKVLEGSTREVYFHF